MDAFLDIARELLGGSSRRFVTRGNIYDQQWIDNEASKPAENVAIGTFPQLVANQANNFHKLWNKVAFTPGAAHPKCPYLILVDAYQTGKEDAKENWTLIYRLDGRKFAAEWTSANPGAPVPWPNVLAKDGAKHDNEWGTGGEIIEWQFDVVNPDDYTEATMGTPHPINTSAVLTAAVMNRNGPIGTVQRRYQMLPVLVDWEYDPETRDVIEVTRQIVMSTSAPGQSTGQEVHQVSLGTDFSLLTTKLINSGDAPTGYSYPSWVDWTRPKILNGIGCTLGSDGNTMILNYDESNGYTKKFAANVLVEFFSSPPSPQSLLQIVPKNLIYNGVAFSVSEHNVLNDEIHVFLASSSIVEEVTFSPSSPISRDTYLGIIGEYHNIAEHVARWKYGWWKRETISIKIE